MRWHDERINNEVGLLHTDLVHNVVLIDLLRRMRDDYEQALLNQRAETIALAQRVTASQAAMWAGVREKQNVQLQFDRYAENQGREAKAKDAEIAELQAQLAAALATIERAVVAPEADTGALYAEGCAP